MARQFKMVNYDESLRQTVTIEECLPPNHLARFIIGVIALLDLRALYAHYASVGGEAFAPEVLLGLLFYGYATGVFSSRKMEQATYDSIPFRFIAGGWHPDHDTLANFRKTFLPHITQLFVQVLVVAHELGYLNLGNISLDGTKVRADASKHHAVSYGRLLELEQQLRTEVAELMALGEQADQGQLPPGLNLETEITFRQERLVNPSAGSGQALAQAKAVLEVRAQERDAAEQAEYAAKLRQREEKAQETGHPPRGRAPQPPTPGPREQDQYNFTDPDSRIMKNPTDAGFDQYYNAQAAVEQEHLLIVGCSLSNHPNDTAEALPTVDTIPPEVGMPAAAALDNGYWSPETIQALAARGIEPYIATGREPHHRSWKE